jgi:GDPmannose 4,6-dehydratase
VTGVQTCALPIFEEKGLDQASGKVLVEIDPRYFRPTEVELLIGDPTKARTNLGWHHDTGLDVLVKDMVAADLLVMANAPVLHNA